MTARPALAVVMLSDSFASVWADVAQELDAELVSLAADDEPPPHAVAAVLAAGGEEERALDVLPALAARARGPLFLVASRTSHRFAVEALRRGATDYFALPGDLDLMRRTLAARIEAGRERARRRGEQVADPFRELIGESPALRAAIDKAHRVLVHRDVTVLIGGETGTGKELLARALHDGGPRAGGPFVPVNCAAIPAPLLESELFGHEKGAFTDAHRAKPGLFEEADGGTLFLDEIGHLPLALQGKLLRALDERRVRRVGATQSRDVDVRIITATHVDLAAAVGRGEFREDLYYRLNVVHLVLPPLRERGADVMFLAETFAVQLARRYGMRVPRLTREARAALQSHTWPGNVRELKHAVERALLLSAPGSLDPAELIPAAPPIRPATDAPPAGPIPFPAPLTTVLHAAVRAALELNAGNKSAAARQLGISRSRLQRLLEHQDTTDADAE
jgi:DNA-binding NtrC family response regulator